MRLVLGEPPADDLMAYLDQLQRLNGVMKLFRDLICSAVNEGVATAFSEG